MNNGVVTHEYALEYICVEDDSLVSSKDALMVSKLYNLVQIDRLSEAPIADWPINIQRRVLERAIRTNDLYIIARLLQNDELVKHITTENPRLIYTAIEIGNLNIINYLLRIEAIAAYIAEPREMGDNRALYLAAHYGHLSVVKRLLEIEMIEKQASLGNNMTLLTAFHNEHVTVADHLMQNKAVAANFVAQITAHVNEIPNTLLQDIHTVTDANIFILEHLLAVKAVYEFVVEFKFPIIIDPLIVAIRTHNQKIACELLLKKDKKNINTLNYALRLAARLGNAHVVFLLLKIDGVRNNINLLMNLLDESREFLSYDVLMVMHDALKYREASDFLIALDKIIRTHNPCWGFHYFPESISYSSSSSMSASSSSSNFDEQCFFDRNVKKRPILELFCQVKKSRSGQQNIKENDCCDDEHVACSSSQAYMS